MSLIENWQGYLISQTDSSSQIFSRWKLNGAAVFGYDSDYTTLAISLIRRLASEERPLVVSEVDKQVSKQVLFAATNSIEGENGLTISCGKDASVIAYTGEMSHSEAPISNMVEIDSEIYYGINQAWQDESNEKNISQGAYVSGQQYDESLESRLSLIAQEHDMLIWPRRQMDNQGKKISENNVRIKPEGKITSWTKLTAAGAPSEFAIRAPILGGISTVMVQTTDGPNGVFLLADDQDLTPQIGDLVEIVVRRLYAQEGLMRYGAKAIINNRS